MPIKNRWSIPDDYDPDTTQWIFVGMCIPNTRMWRGIISGSIYNLTRGRYWDESTGVIVDAQEIGRAIFGSLTMDCNNNWERIATAMESIDSKTPGLLTLQEFITDLGNSTIGDVSAWIEFLTAVTGLLPNIDIRMSPVEWVRFVTDYLWKRNMLAAVKDLVTTEKIENLIESGETVAEGVEAIDGWVDDIADWAEVLLSGANVGADFLAAYAAIRSLYTGDGSNEDSELRNVNRLVNDVFVEGDTMSVNVSNFQNVNCGGSGLGPCGGGTGFIADQNPSGSSIDDPGYTLPDAGEGDPPPIGWDTWGGEDGYLAYKCKASNALVLGFAERMYQLSDMANEGASRETAMLTTQTIEMAIRAIDQSYIELASISPAPLFTNDVDNPILVATRSWVAQKLTDVFYPTDQTSDLSIFASLRLDWLQDRESRVCDLFSSETTSEALQSILDAVDGYFSGYSESASVKSWARDIIEANVLHSWLNQLFKKNDTVDGYTDATAIDCGVCDPGDHFDSCHAEPFDDEDTPITVESVPGCGNSYGCEAVLLLFDHDGTEHHDDAREFYVSVANGPIDDCAGREGTERYFYYDLGGELLLESETQDTGQECHSILIMGSIPFTCTVTITEV